MMPFSTKLLKSDADATARLLLDGPHTIVGIMLQNVAASTRYIKVWDRASAAEVVVGTTVPDYVLSMGALSGAGLNHTVGSSGPFKVRQGFVYAVTTGYAHTDTTAGSANDVIGSISAQPVYPR